MSQYLPQISSQSLEDKVVLITGMFPSGSTHTFPRQAPAAPFPGLLLTFPLTGGANGIGASLVRQCLESGANVCFGDLDNINGERLLRKSVDEFKPTEAPIVLMYRSHADALTSRLLRTASCNPQPASGRPSFSAIATLPPSNPSLPCASLPGTMPRLQHLESCS